MYDTSPEICVHGAVPGVGLMLINALLCLHTVISVVSTKCRENWSFAIIEILVPLDRLF